MSKHSVSILSLLAPHRRKVITAVTLQILATGLSLIPYIMVYLIAQSFLSSPVEQNYIWILAIASIALFLLAIDWRLTIATLAGVPLAWFIYIR